MLPIDNFVKASFTHPLCNFPACNLVPLFRRLICEVSTGFSSILYRIFNWNNQYRLVSSKSTENSQIIWAIWQYQGFFEVFYKRL
jgi:hypothetical protein